MAAVVHPRAIELIGRVRDLTQSVSELMRAIGEMSDLVGGLPAAIRTRRDDPIDDGRGPEAQAPEPTVQDLIDAVGLLEELRTVWLAKIAQRRALYRQLSARRRDAF